MQAALAHLCFKEKRITNTAITTGSKIRINFCLSEKEWEDCYIRSPKVGKVRSERRSENGGGLLENTSNFVEFCKSMPVVGNMPQPIQNSKALRQRSILQ